MGILGIDPASEPDRARQALDSHLARARWTTEVGYRELVTRNRPDPSDPVLATLFPASLPDGTSSRGQAAYRYRRPGTLATAPHRAGSSPP